MSERPAPPREPPLLFRPDIVLAVIVLNALCIFADGFPAVRAAAGRLFLALDLLFLVYFLAEAAEKMHRRGVAGYFASGWNRFDFLVLACSLPSLAAPFADLHAYSSLLALRLGRIFRFARLLRFVPDGERILSGVLRALRASVAIFLTLILLVLVLGMISAQLFCDLSPEHFGDPLRASYSIFKVFTVEGWYATPEELSSGTAAAPLRLLIHGFFVVSVLLGILSLSLANAVFVDEMTADNTHTLERLVAELTGEVQALRDEVRALRRTPETPPGGPPAPVPPPASVGGPPADI